jgi:hypothetical protein
MIVAMPGVVAEGVETATAYDVGCAGGPLALMGMIAGR